MDIEKLEIDRFVQQAQTMYRRIADLYQNANTLPLTPNLLPQAFMELGTASEIVQLATEKLYQQNEELLETRNLVEAEHQRYQDLFEFAPDGYLVSDVQGVILQANRTAARLLNVSQQFLAGKPMINFITLEDRHRFRYELVQLAQSDRVRELTLRLQQRNGECFDAAFTVAAVRNLEGKASAFRWLLRDITQRQQGSLVPFNIDCDLSFDRPVHQHSKGEIIPNSWQAIWYVCRGFVKLSTLCETGEEVLVGLAGVGMIFGSDMTSLKTYQATALSDVELVSISLSEIAATPMLSHALLPKFKQRLRQTESFLVLVGRRRVQDRLYDLLRLLKREIGQTVAEGTRLNVRLTHEELANACCTTRVTITRLINKLQQQGKISFDSKKHLILKDID
ncbi:MAG: PAS domain S-box protein [Stigonema ocellatum SAG 48.90 = DSM 106950]|nr:PAS domain S-box protein [Stigonema ocellatum SAG 48.90 = DSM 106950]